MNQFKVALNRRDVFFPTSIDEKDRSISCASEFALVRTSLSYLGGDKTEKEKEA